MKLSKIVVLAIAPLLFLEAQAADAPKRKSGLWEMKTQMAGMPSQGAMQICVDQASDNITQERAKEKANCPVMDITHSGGKVIIHAVCKHEQVTTTSDSVMTGDFESGYHNEMSIKYDPPQHGTSNMKMTQDARWLGPCKAGQKPGDLIMPGMPTMNMQELMKQQSQRK